MADGRVTIDIILDEKGAVKGIAGLEDSLNGVGKKASTVGSSFKGMLAGLGVFKLVSGGLSLISSSVGSAIKRFDTLNNSTRVFENMGFSAEETSGMMENLNASIAGLPTPIDSAISGVQLLVGSVGNLDKSQQIFAALNNGILGFGGNTEQVQNAVMQLSQAFSNGKVDAETWNSMIDSGLGPALNALAKQMGMTSGELKKGLSDGTVSVETFQDALIDLNKNGGGGLASLEKIAKDSTAGINTGIANAKTAVTRGVAGIVEAIDNALKGADLGGIGGVIAAVGTGFEKALKYVAGFVPVIGQVFAAITNSTAFQSLIDVVGMTIDKFKELATAFLDSQAFETIKTAAKEFGQALLDIDFVAVIQQVGEFIDKWGPLIAGLAGAVIAFQVLSSVIPVVVAAFNGFKIIMTLVKTVGLLQTAFTFLAPLIGAISWPIVAAAAVIGILIAAGVALYKNWDVVKAKASEVWTGIQSLATTVWGAITAFFTEVGTRIKTKFIEDWNQIAEFFSTTWTFIVDMATSIWTGIVEFFSGIWSTIVTSATNDWNELVAFLVGIWTSIVGFATPIFSAIGAFFTSVWDGIKIATAFAWEAIKAVLFVAVGAIYFIIYKPLEMIATFIFSVWQRVAAATVAAWTSISTAISTAWTTISTIVVTYATAIWNSIVIVFNAVLATIITVWTTITTAITTAWTAIYTSVSSVLTQVWTVISSIFNQVAAFISAVWKTISSTIMNAWNMIYSTVTAAVNRVLSIIMAVFNTVKSFITSVWNTIKSIIMTAWSNIYNNVTSNVNRIRSIVTSVFNAVKSIITNVWNSVKSTTTSVWNSIKNSVTNIINNIKSTFSNIFNSLRSIVSNAFNNVKSAVSTGMSNAYNAVTEYISKFYDAGKNIIGSIVDGITSKVGAIKDAAGNIAGTIRDFFPFSPAKRGPLKKLHKTDFGWALTTAIDHSKKKVTKSLDNLLQVPNSKNLNFGVNGNVSGNVSLPKTSSALSQFNNPSAYVNRVARSEQAASNDLTPLINNIKEMANAPIIVEIDIDGKKITRELANPMKKEIEKIDAQKAIIARGKKA